jgi:hypothetical protein
MDGDNYTPIPARSRSQSPPSRGNTPPSRNDTTPTPPTQPPLDPTPKKLSSSGYLDHFPESWALPDSESTPPSPPRDVDIARLKPGIQSDPDILQARRDPRVFSRPLNRFQERSISMGDPSGLFALQRQPQRVKLSTSFMGQRRDTGNWLADFQELQTAKSQPIPLRQKLKVGANDESTRTDPNIKPENMLWLERLEQIKALKANSMVEKDQSEESDQCGDEVKGHVDAKDDSNSNFTQNYVQSESGYSDVPHRRPRMSDTYSYTSFSVRR